tara:strand:+ start:1242 stop:3107 length:1866 start_codon:yes stop_codon:yes gene_type:complete
MAGLFGSGPSSNILQTVQSSYGDMLNAEKQKGVSAQAAMGAFGQAISPKAIGMNQFKNDFKDADWNKPETYQRAGEQIMQFDPNGGLAMMDKGRALAASLAPKDPVWQEIKTDNPDGSSTIKYVDMNTYQGQTYDSSAPQVADQWKPQSRTVDGVEVNGVFLESTGVWKSLGGTGKSKDPSARTMKTVVIDGVDTVVSVSNTDATDVQTVGKAPATAEGTKAVTFGERISGKELQKQGKAWAKAGVSYSLKSNGEWKAYDPKKDSEGNAQQTYTQMSGDDMNKKYNTDYYTADRMYEIGSLGGVKLLPIPTEKSTTAPKLTTRIQEAQFIHPDDTAKQQEYVSNQTKIQEAGEAAGTSPMQNAQFLYPDDVTKQQEYVLEQTKIKDVQKGTKSFLSTLDPDNFTVSSLSDYMESMTTDKPNGDTNLLVRYQELSTKAEDALIEAQNLTLTSRRKAESTRRLASNPDVIASMSSGAWANFQEGLKSFLGTEDAVTEFRTEFTRITNSQIIGSLPAGPASDKDIALIAEGFPSGSSDPVVLTNWLEAFAKLQDADATYNKFKSGYISKNNSTKGMLQNWDKFIGVPEPMLNKYKAAIADPKINNKSVISEFRKKYGFNPEGLI